MTAVARILVVDNDPQTCQDLDELLTPHGYEVYTVSGAEADIMAEALALAPPKRPHVVVVDLRLQDDYMDEYSGLDLLHSFESAHTILYSAYLTSDAIREARDLLFDWIRKHDAALILRNGVRQAAAEKSALASETEVLWPAGIDPDELAAGIADPALPPPPPHMLDDVVVQLCAGARQVRLQPLRRTQSAPSGASRTRSAVFLMQQDDRQPAVLKFARHKQIRTEQTNYEQYVEQRLPGPYSAHQMKVARFWDIGAVTYTFMGTGMESLPTFTDFYHRTQTPAAILAPLRFFFQDIWGHYYQSAEPLTAHSLVEAYDQLFELRRHKLELDRFYYTMLRSDSLPLKGHNPLTWLTFNEEKSRLPHLRQAITHGDLHGDNLFVDGAHSWVIDFERTGPGHVLRDFAELEVDILTRLVPLDQIDDAHYLDLLTKLYAPWAVASSGAETASTFAQPDLQKAYAVVRGLRTLAYDLVKYRDEEYLWSVLLDALFVVSISAADIWQRRRALLLSAVVCNALR